MDSSIRLLLPPLLPLQLALHWGRPSWRVWRCQECRPLGVMLWQPFRHPLLHLVAVRLLLPWPWWRWRRLRAGVQPRRLPAAVGPRREQLAV
jgi:hypothetical protein